MTEAVNVHLPHPLRKELVLDHEHGGAQASSVERLPISLTSGMSGTSRTTGESGARAARGTSGTSEERARKIRTADGTGASPSLPLAQARLVEAVAA